MVDYLLNVKQNFGFFFTKFLVIAGSYRQNICIE